MNERSAAPATAVRGTATLEPETPTPFLHDRGTVVYNPVTGASLEKDGEAWRALQAIGTPAGGELRADPAVLAHLRAARFLIEDAAAGQPRQRP